MEVLLTGTDISTTCAIGIFRVKLSWSRQFMVFNSSYWPDWSIKSRYYGSSVSLALMVLAMKTRNVIGAFSKPEAKSQSTKVLFWTTFTRTIILNLLIPTLGGEIFATNRFEKSGCRTSTRNARLTRKGDLTQVLLSHALSVVISVRQTFGCVLSFGVTDAFIAHDRLIQ